MASFISGLKTVFSASSQIFLAYEEETCDVPYWFGPVHVVTARPLDDQDWLCKAVSVLSSYFTVPFHAKAGAFVAEKSINEGFDIIQRIFQTVYSPYSAMIEDATLPKRGRLAAALKLIPNASPDVDAEMFQKICQVVEHSYDILTAAELLSVLAQYPKAQLEKWLNEVPSEKQQGFVLKFISDSLDHQVAVKPSEACLVALGTYFVNIKTLSPHFVEHVWNREEPCLMPLKGLIAIQELKMLDEISQSQWVSAFILALEGTKVGSKEQDFWLETMAKDGVKLLKDESIEIGLRQQLALLLEISKSDKHDVLALVSAAKSLLASKVDGDFVNLNPLPTDITKETLEAWYTNTWN